MEIQKKGKEIIIRHVLKKNEVYRISESRKFQTLTISKKPKKVTGVSSYCEDGKHVLFIDWDTCALWVVLADFKRIQEEYALPPGYLFASKKEEVDENGDVVGNFHLICLKKFYPKEIYEIITKTHADVNYMSMPLRNKYRGWVLRISPKGKRDRPHFSQIVGENINLNERVSEAHFEFLKKIYPDIPNIKFTNFDGLDAIKINFYETLN
ncbi:MAG: hypothetical protein AABY22_00610 [Nanoarchaeota archaeon]